MFAVVDTLEILDRGILSHEIRNLFIKYFNKKSLPDESSLRKNHLSTISEENLEKIFLGRKKDLFYQEDDCMCCSCVPVRFRAAEIVLLEAIVVALGANKRAYPSRATSGAQLKEPFQGERKQQVPRWRNQEAIRRSHKEAQREKN